MFSNRRTTRNNKSPKVLKATDLPSLAKYIKSNDCGNVMLMLGAGVSTSAGIPDFRSPETGLYSNLARLNLPHPEAVFEINFFRRNPVPFYTLAHELYPGKFRPTITHSFIRLLAEKGLLHTCFTQNIDTLERRAGVPGEKIIEAHGSFASQRCIDCFAPVKDEKMKEHILQKKILKCTSCGGYVKPDIVFFGEALPENFIAAVPNLRKADLLIVMGTSLTVQPFASLANRVDDSCPRVLINLDRVGDFGARSDDVILLGKCDEIVRDLCRELGWEEELVKLWEQTEGSVVGGGDDEDADGEEEGKDEAEAKTAEEKERDILEEIEAQFAELGLTANGPEANEKSDKVGSTSKTKSTSSSSSKSSSPKGKGTVPPAPEAASKNAAVNDKTDDPKPASSADDNTIEL